MKVGMRASVRALLLVGLGTMLVAGCPLAPLPLDLQNGPEPGSYYVEQQDGKLFYFKLANQPGDPHEWIALATGADWYEGPGFYVVDQNLNWSPDKNAENLTLDEFLQLYDPTPAATP